ncbi:protein FAR1-RELATED SEQUENCE 5-like [Spinacia oleracea]|uniref:Protein FAR1-RELATED SEQUENCE 5-like n=1 Tax=Spinacia oleracea TaxID=3562 RepID=A0ABM3QR96_SPIOL|nr:protein FAR1-RELATED SEQUENCE 5-like [Spinacia oleracea]
MVEMWSSHPAMWARLCILLLHVASALDPLFTFSPDLGLSSSSFCFLELPVLFPPASLLGLWLSRSMVIQMFGLDFRWSSSKCPVSVFVASKSSVTDFEEPVLLEGSVVKDDDEAYELYNSHAFRDDFGTRKGKKEYRSGTRIVRQRFFVCAYERFRNPDGITPKYFFKNYRRTGCKALVQFDVDKKTGSVGTKLADILRAMRKEVGGEAHLGFTVPDAYDVVTAEKKKILDVDNLFLERWRMWSDYEAFGDLLIHDTTYRTNKYNMICGPFFGMNLHTENIIFGVGFILNERTSTFEWLFNSFLTSMGGKQPVTIMTDRYSAMDKAIRDVFPKSRHRLCTWHIGENAAVNIKVVMDKEGFKRRFDCVLKYTDTVTEFEHYWNR